MSHPQQCWESKSLCRKGKISTIKIHHWPGISYTPCTRMYNLPWLQLLPKSGTFGTFVRTVPLPRHLSTYRPERASGLILNHRNDGLSTIVSRGRLFLRPCHPATKSWVFSKCVSRALSRAKGGTESRTPLQNLERQGKKKTEFVYQKNRPSFWNRKEPRGSWIFKDK